ncbi:MAG: hypothetical protein JST01_08205 [Cyanobacteria bacterium SZAS TMP-1]|nr:hypothetical protein [Cyanobacteria bacterium SZAS TMP-1]
MQGKFTDWLYLDEGLIPILSRLVGLISLPIAAVVWFFAHSGCGLEPYPQPFNVPAWRFGTYLVPVPLPPEPLNLIVFGLFALAAVALIAGKAHRPLYIYMAAVLAYYCSRDFFVCMLHWILLDFLFLVALAFRTQGRPSPARRLIQLTICSCYIFAVIQKIFYPDFWLGLSLEANFYDGFAVTSPFKAFFIQHQLPMSFWQASSILLLVLETFVAIALFFKQTRIAACILGIFLHGGILMMMDPILSLFSLEMWLGYLAFFPGNKKVENTTDGTARPPLQTAFSLVYIAVLIIMPMRIYFLGGPPPELLTLFERTPWTFGMFLMRQKQEQIEMAFEDEKGERHSLEATGRMKTASNDNELISIAQYILKNNPGAKEISINDSIIVNERRRVLRTLVWRNPGQAGSEPQISVTNAGEYCRGAANRNPEPDHRP